MQSTVNAVIFFYNYFYIKLRKHGGYGILLPCNHYVTPAEIAPYRERRRDRVQEKKLDTKAQIFDVSLRLFAASGVENVSMRDIAYAVGIKVASIYNHYSSKEEIVEACYDFFLEYHDSTRPSEDQYSIILQNGTKEEIVNVPNNQFPQELEGSLVNAMTVLFSRMYTDTKAIEKYTKMIDHSLQFLEKFFKRGIELGRFGEFNIRRVSLLFLSARLFAAQSTTIHPETLRDTGLDQRDMILELINTIPFKY